MRKDITKVLALPPRYGSSTYSYRDVRSRSKRDIEDAPQKESMRLQYRDRKELSDFLSPLYGFLARKVGKSWNKTYSEVRSVLRIDGVMHKHVYDHLLGMVDLAPFFEGKKVFSLRYGKHELRDGTFYVDKTGVLRKYKRNKVTPRRYVDDPRVKVTHTEEYRKINNIWYYVWYRKCPYGEKFYDVILHACQPTQYELSWIHGIKKPNELGFDHYFYAHKVMQVSKREIKQQRLDHYASLAFGKRD